MVIADSNNDNMVTVNEIYNYSRDCSAKYQDVQIYPLNSALLIADFRESMIGF